MDGERLLELLMKEGADYAEVRFHRNVEVSGLLKNGEPESPEYVEVYGVGVRVLKGGSLAFASTNVLDWDSLKATGLRALRMA
ncbi:MAG: DNA gyrase modulator, partial [Candidatus Methanomethylicaceae archaeon]